VGRHTVGGIAGVAGFVLVLLGLSALGDAPDPGDDAAPLAHYFVEHRNSVFAGTTLVALAGVAIIIFLAVLLTRLDDPVARPIVFAAGLGVVAIFELNELIYLALAYSVGHDDPSTAKSLFVMTIVASNLLGAVVALLLGTVALRRGTLPRWFAWASGIGAVLVPPAMVSFGGHGFFYPDVQQQVIAQVFLLWLVIGAIVLWRGGARRSAA